MNKDYFKSEEESSTQIPDEYLPSQWGEEKEEEKEQRHSIN